LWKQRSRVDFTNILQSAFTRADPKSSKRHWWLDCLFALLESACAKAALKHVGEIDPRWQMVYFIWRALLRVKSRRTNQYWHKNLNNNERKKLHSILLIFKRHIFHQFPSWKIYKHKLQHTEKQATCNHNTFRFKIEAT